MTIGCGGNSSAPGQPGTAPIEPRNARSKTEESETIWSDIWHLEAHHSTALEGNTLVLREVEQLLEQGRAVGAKPLKEYLESLAAVRGLDPTEVLPAHEWRFRGLDDRVDQLAAHHEQRLTELLTAVRQHPGSTPWELAAYLTWSRPWEQYERRMRIFADTETDAHLRLLASRGLVVSDGGAVPTWTLAVR